MNKSLEYKKREIAYFYLAILFIYFIITGYNNYLLYQIHPVVFNSRLDLSLNIVLLSNLHKLIIHHYFYCLILDIFYLLSNIFMVYLILKNKPAQHIVAIITTVCNFIYLCLISIYTPICTEVLLPFFLLPILYFGSSNAYFYYTYQVLRYLFLLFFGSSGLWKIQRGAVFNQSEMSSILFRQHANLLSFESKSYYYTFIQNLINHPILSFGFYIVGAMLETFFLIGFFTEKADKILMVLLLLFIVFDFIIMRITYFPWVAFVCLFWYPTLNEKAEIL